MTREKACSILGLAPAPYLHGPVSVRAAFSEAIKRNHPDTCADASGERTFLSMDVLKQARDLMLKDTVDSIMCPTCKGFGSVRSGAVAAVCKTCKGSGKA